MTNWYVINAYEVADWYNYVEIVVIGEEQRNAALNLLTEDGYHAWVKQTWEVE